MAGICVALTAVYTASIGYRRVFGGFAFFDDEGYLAATFRSYLSSGHLYTETFSQYGPGYYGVFGTIFQVSGINLDSLVPGRVLALVFVVLGSSGAGLAVWLATRVLSVAVAAQLVIYVLLVETAGDTGLHPGPYLVFLQATLAVIFFLPPTRWRTTVPVALGVVLALMVTTKINVGGLALCGVVGAACAGGSSRILKALAATGLVLVPVAITGPNLADQDEMRFMLVVTIGVVVALSAVAAGPPIATRRRQVELLGASLAAMSVLACLPVVLSGSSITDLIQGALIAPTRLQAVFFHPYGIFASGSTVAYAQVLVLVCSVAAVGVGVVAARRLEEPLRSWVVASIKLLGGVVAVMTVALDDSSAALPTLCVLAAVSAIPLPAYTQTALQGRRGLLLVAVLQPLHAYPVASAQVEWGSFLLVVVAFLNAGDGISALAALLREPSVQTGRLAVRSIASVLLLVTAYGGWLYGGFASETHWQRFDLRPGVVSEADRARVPLELAGSPGIRVTPDSAQTYRKVVAILREHCDSYYSMPGLNSFYVFAKMPLVTGRNATAWPGLFDDEVQNATVEDLRAFPGRLCLVRNAHLLAFWQQGAPPRGPLVDFLRRFTQEVGRSGFYVVLVDPDTI